MLVGDAGGSPRGGVWESQAGAPRGRPVGREASTQGSDVSGGGAAHLRSLTPTLAQRESGGQLDAAVGTPCIGTIGRYAGRSYWPGGCVGGADAHLDNETGNGTAGAPEHPGYSEVVPGARVCRIQCRGRSDRWRLAAYAGSEGAFPSIALFRNPRGAGHRRGL